MFAGEPMPARAWGVEHLTPLERVEEGHRRRGGPVRRGGHARAGRRGSSAPGRSRRTVSTIRHAGCSGRSSSSDCSTTRSSTRTARWTPSAGPTSSPPAPPPSAPRSSGSPPPTPGRPALPLAAGQRIYVEGIDEDAAARLGSRRRRPGRCRSGRPSAGRTVGGAPWHLRVPASTPARWSSPPPNATASCRSARRCRPCRSLPGPAGGGTRDRSGRGGAAGQLRRPRRRPGRRPARRSPGPGRLPFDLPSSMQAVIDSPSDVPFVPPIPSSASATA